MTSPSTIPPRDYLGRRLGDFILVERISEGGFGAIFVAEQVGLSRRAVVKIPRSRFVRDETTRLRFLREARLASTLDHPYAAHVYAFGVEPDGVSWIAMELVRGSPLSERLREGPMPLRDFVPFFERLCEVVQTAHERGIIHRDIKPQNVMVIARAGALLPKLLDLGIAKDEATAATEAEARTEPHVSWISSLPALTGGGSLTVSEGTSPSSMSGPRQHSTGATPTDGHTRTTLTVAGDLVGSPAYMAPEQWTRADQVDARCDIYALGVLAYEALAGRRPFQGTLHELAEQHILARVPPLPESLPAELYTVLARAMAKEPRDRPGTALDLAHALREASGLGLEGLELPRLARDAAELALRDFPQPIAEAVVELDGARGAYRALEAAARLTQVILRFLTVVALAACAHQGGQRQTAARELISALRKRRLEEEERLDLLRALLAPGAASSIAHPVPELAQALRGDSPAAHALTALVDRRAARARRPSLAEAAAVDELSFVLGRTSELLRTLAFLADYPLAVVTAEKHAELWTGVRSKYRSSRPLDIEQTLEPGTPVLLDREDRPLVLAPLALAAKPSANAEPELFLLDGRGRRGVALVALPAGFEQSSDEALAWIDRVFAPSDAPESTVPTLAVPYRGLAPLTAADAEVFFGREREVEAFMNRLLVEPLLVLVGPSGAGKSSFARAGVVASLNESFHPIVFRPGASPMTTLAARVAQLDAQTDAPGDAPPSELAARVRAAAAAKGETVVLVVDQFEEVFTLAEDPAERAAFCATLAAIAESASSPARVVLTLRDDFLARLKDEPGFRQRLDHALALLSTPDGAALRRILVEPARRAGFGYESDALVEEMVGAVEGRPGALALLSFAASKLWEQRDVAARTLTTAAYRAMGGVGGALAKHGEEVLEAMAPRQRLLVREALRRLVTAEGTRAATRHAELIAALGGDESARDVVERLVAARLLVVVEGDDGVDSVEVIHEALFSAWPRLVEWQREDAAGNRLRDQIRAAAELWEARKRPRSLLWRDELVEDYRRWRKQHPVGLTASEEAFGKASVAERNRGRRLRAIGMVVLALAAASTSYLAWQQTLARKAAQHATEDAREANRQADQATFRARDAARLTAVRLHSEDPTTQLALLRDVEASEMLPDWAPEARAALHSGVAELVLSPNSEGTWSVAFSPDGRRLACASQDGTVSVWNADGTGTPLVLRGHSGSVDDLAFSPDGRHIASASFDHTVRVWSVDAPGEPVVFRGHEGEVWSVAFGPDGRRVASASDDKTVRVWNADATGEPLVLRGHAAGVKGVSFSPDGRHVASASSDKTVRVWDTAGEEKPRVLVGHKDEVYSARFSADGRRIVSTGLDKTVRVWDLASGESRVFPVPDSTYRAIFSPDGRRVASAGTEKTVRVWNVDSEGEPVVLRGHTSPIFGLAFSPDGRAIASSDGTGTVRVWRADVADDPQVLRGHTQEVEAIAASADGRRIASASDDGTVRVWNADGSGEPFVFRGHTGRVTGVAMSLDGQRVASASFDQTVRVWNADGSGTPVVLRGHTRSVGRVTFSPDGRHVASASFDKTARVWNADGEGEPVVMHDDDNGLAIAFSPDGRRVVTASLDDTLRVWNADGSGEPLVLKGHAGRIFGVAFSPDGRKVVSGSQDKTVRVWNADGSGEPVILRGHGAIVTGVAFSPDGRQVASSSYDKTLRVWNADGTGEPVVLHGHTEVANGVTFAPDGKRLFSVSDDKTVRIWSDLAPLLPGDRRLWERTRYCLPNETLEDLLGLDEAVARKLHERCQENVERAAR